MITVTNEQLTSLRELGIDLAKILAGLGPKGAAKKRPQKVAVKDMTPKQLKAHWDKLYK